jgi:hypothetical protein
MTPTREQLELAAKASGIVIHHWFGDDPRIAMAKPNSKDEKYRTWLPWKDKSDSFDLMVACEIELKYFDSCVTSACFSVPYKDHNNDKGLATMWAVFLCAVEIGRDM